MTCHYCKKDPGSKKTGVWKGFRDGDMHLFVCFGCQRLHYQTKFAQPEFKNLYSEFPVIGFIPPTQLTLRF